MDYTYKTRFSIGYYNGSLDRALTKNTLTSRTHAHWDDSCQHQYIFTSPFIFPPRNRAGFGPDSSSAILSPDFLTVGCRSQVQGMRNFLKFILNVYYYCISLP